MKKTIVALFLTLSFLSVEAFGWKWTQKAVTMETTGVFVGCSYHPNQCEYFLSGYFTWMYVTKGDSDEAACPLGSFRSYCKAKPPMWEDYYWAGAAPHCGSYRYKECASGYKKIAKDEYGDGGYCASGAKALCVLRLW